MSKGKTVRHQQRNPSLEQLWVDVPTLVVAGEYDEAMPHTWAPFVERIPNVRSHVFPGASHMPHVETPEEFLAVVGDFLHEHDTP